MRCVTFWAQWSARRAISHTTANCSKRCSTKRARKWRPLRDELEHTRQQVTLDALTGLKNRRAFETALQDACSHANMPATPSPCCWSTSTTSRSVNDTYGHLIGDKVIRSVGALLSANIKGKDTVARMGGEEFSVLLPETPLVNAERVGEALRAAIERSRLTRADTGETVGRVTVSIGVTVYRPGESNDNFMERADKALYISKKAGRNRVSVLGSGPRSIALKPCYAGSATSFLATRELLLH